ncbi:N-acetylneuraminate synthase family protein [Thermanaerovibrio velox]|uniref:N-acetylneuraminate synthase family protein n=1 Tax=Thermanaerovibrio velox TaxID=108007 RepID=UPI002479BD53|nr:N-acetylneuraminate synthase family protein [Thermanaerovibrio velox]
MKDKPSKEALFKAYSSEEGQEVLRDRVTLLHCTTEYPAPLEGVNLRSMVTMREAFGLSVGYSDHTEGIGISLAAVALGAAVLEKHFTLDRSLPGPDHRASLEPLELAELVKSVRAVQLALGSQIKVPSSFEWENRRLVRRSVVARRTIQRGEVFAEDNLTCKRPGTGLPPSDVWRLLGKPSSRDYIDDEMVED